MWSKFRSCYSILINKVSDKIDTVPRFDYIETRDIQAIQKRNMILLKLITAVAALAATATAGVVRRGKDISMDWFTRNSED